MSMSRIQQQIGRAVLVLGLAAVASGCSWFRASTGYGTSPESRPLEVPPDLDQPRIDPSMKIPAPTQQSQRAPAPSSAAFVISDAPESAYRRLGLALERIEGVVVTQKAQALSAYNVSYSGADFLVRVVAEGQQSRIEAVGIDGNLLSSGAASQLLGLLRARLG